MPEIHEETAPATQIAGSPAQAVPEILWLNPEGQYARIVTSKGPLGHCQRVAPYEQEGRQVVVEIGLPPEPLAARLHILLHEALHLAAETLKEAGLIKRQPDEAFVANAAGPLFALLACNGLLRGIDPDSAKRWVSEPGVRDG